MQNLIWIGTLLALAGIGLLLWCALKVLGARRAELDDEAMRALLAKLTPMNSGALFLAIIGLMMVIVGIMLG